jgi:hypothetical protein
VVSNRVLIVTPDGPATRFTPRQSRNATAVTHSIILNRYDKLGTSITGRRRPVTVQYTAEPQASVAKGLVATSVPSASVEMSKSENT